MAFEDRSSPNTATSPCASDCGGNFNTPNSPESTRTSPYTCMTISNSQECRPYSPVLETPSTKNKGNPKMEHIERSFFRITSFALPSSKTECDRDSPVSYRSSSPIGGVASSVSPPPSNDPVIQTLKYSIRNILQPDFGKSAVLKTKDLSEISFRPYENTSSDNQQKALFRIAPLGSLCQTVSQIGSTNSTTNLTLHLSSNINTNSVLSRKSQSPKLKNPNLLSPEEVKKDDNNVPKLWPAWVYCTRYSDRPSSGPRSRRVKKPQSKTEDKRPRTAFSSAQLARLKAEFNENRYLTESRRHKLSTELGLNEAQIKIWFQNKRAKIKKSSGQKNPLALQLMAQGLYNHSTVPCDDDDMPLNG